MYLKPMSELLLLYVPELAKVDQRFELVPPGHTAFVLALLLSHGLIELSNLEDLIFK